jgi:hypothetical protein
MIFPPTRALDYEILTRIGCRLHGLYRADDGLGTVGKRRSDGRRFPSIVLASESAPDPLMLATTQLAVAREN